MRYEDENIWLTQRMLATLYGVKIPTINYYIKKIFDDMELVKEATIRKFLIVQSEGNRQVSREVEHYNLQMIFAVGFKVNNERAVQFRKWANQIVKDYTIKGFAMDDERLKNGGFILTEQYFEEQLQKRLADVWGSEYIRRRRMTLAAFELQNSNTKVIDLAIKYGYESPDSFSRAFQNVHGILPSIARNAGISLKAYPRITFHISIKGDAEMKYRIEKKEAFKIVGIKRNFQGPNDDESAVPKFWNEIYLNGIYEEILSISNGNPKGVHGFIQVLSEEKVDYTIACISDKEPPKGMNSYIIPESTWAIFEVDGPVNIAMADAWKRIFSEWLPTSSYKYAETIDVEYFPYQGDKRAPDYRFEIWLPVIKNE